MSDEGRLLRNLLAVIHREGGHYVCNHGIDKACADAMKEWYARSATIDALRAENERLRKALTEAIKSVAAWGSFANEYEQDRYRLSDEIVRLSAALEATK